MACCCICLESIEESNLAPNSSQKADQASSNLTESSAYHCPSCAKFSCYGCLAQYCSGITNVPQCPHCQVHIPQEVLWDLANHGDSQLTYQYWLKLIRAKVPAKIIAQSGHIKDRVFRLTAVTNQMAAVLDKVMDKTTTATDRSRYGQQFRELSAVKRSIMLDDSSGAKVAAKQVIVACTAPNCRGLVDQIGQGWTCTLCKSKICSQCRVVISNDQHHCDPDELKSVQAMLANSRACPNCHTRIHKDSGCDQMWCVCCNTAFNWSSGQKISTVNFHNVHYQEWLSRNRTGPVVFDDAQCLELIPLDIVQNRVGPNKDIVAAYSKHYEWLTELNLAQTEVNNQIAKFNQRQTNALNYYFRDSDHSDTVEKALFECYQKIALHRELEGFRAVILPIGISLVNQAGSPDQGDNVLSNLQQLDQLQAMYTERVGKLNQIFTIWLDA